MMRYVTILLLFPLTAWAQNTLTGRVSVSKDWKFGRGISLHDTSTGLYKVKTTRDKDGGIKTDIMYASYTLLKDNKPIATGITSSDGQFEIKNLSNGSYLFRVFITKVLKIDTAIEVTKNKTIVDIFITDKKIYAAEDSSNQVIASYNEEKARHDIKTGSAKLLSAGLRLYFQDEKFDSVTLKYGFKYFSIAGCLVNNYHVKAMTNYNGVVYNYLDSLNGPNWKRNLDADLEFMRLESQRKIKR